MKSIHQLKKLKRLKCPKCKKKTDTLDGYCRVCWTPVQYANKAPQLPNQHKVSVEDLQRTAKTILCSMGYKEYLKTEWWQLKRKQKLQSTNFKCEYCPKEAIQVHHKHYKTISKETNDDLESLCAACHLYQHQDIIDMDNHIRAIANGV